MTELPVSTLTVLQTIASVGLIVCLVLAGAFATLGFVTSNVQDRKQASIESERLVRLDELLRENETIRSAEAPPREVAATPEPQREPTVSAPVIDETPVQIAEADQEPALESPEPLESESGQTDIVPDDTIVSVAPPEENEAPASDDVAPVEEQVAAAADTAGPLPTPPSDLREQLTPPQRRLADSEANAIVEALQGQGGLYSVEVVTAPEQEARVYALQLIGALRRAGIDAQGPVAVISTMQTDGIVVSAEASGVGPGADLLSALQSSGLTALPAPTTSGRGDIMIPDGTDVRLYVGASPMSGFQPSSPPEGRTQRAMEDA